VSLLVENGHLDKVRQLAPGGDGNCAAAIAKDLIGQGRRDEAVEVLLPFAQTGWWGLEKVSSLLEECGCADEAVAVVRPRAEAGERDAVERLARLLHRIGRVDEAFDLLRDRVDDWWLAQALVDVADGQGRDEEVAALLAPHVQVLQRPGAWSYSAWNAVRLLSVVRDRQGLVDQAIAALRENIEHGTTNTNTMEALADLLARHGRDDELREFIAGRGGDRAVFRWATYLEEAGDVEGAIALLRPLAARDVQAPDRSTSAAQHLSALLARHGRIGEAIEILRPIPGQIGYACGCVISMLCLAMAELGCADEALEVIASVPYADDSALDLFILRIEMLKLSGRREQAIAELRAHPDVGNWRRAWDLADLLADDGRLDEAVEVLTPLVPDDEYATTELARLKIRQGRVEKALDLLRNAPYQAYSDPWATASNDGAEQG
jgi:thioredoxin-like negative regulator of GroEL